jgi:hypothetical protein
MLHTLSDYHSSSAFLFYFPVVHLAALKVAQTVYTVLTNSLKLHEEESFLRIWDFLS